MEDWNEDAYLKLCRLCLIKLSDCPNSLTDEKVRDEISKAISDIEVILL